MARFHLDQNVSAALARALRALGHDVMTTNEAGLLDADDDAQLLAAAKAVRILVTHNGHDFLLLHRAWHRWSRDWQTPRSHAGILVIPQYPPWSLEQAARELHAISPTSLTDQLYDFDFRTGQGWFHYPPLSA